MNRRRAPKTRSKRDDRLVDDRFLCTTEIGSSQL